MVKFSLKMLGPKNFAYYLSNVCKYLINIFMLEFVKENI